MNWIAALVILVVAVVGWVLALTQQQVGWALVNIVCLSPLFWLYVGRWSVGKALRSPVGRSER